MAIDAPYHQLFCGMKAVLRQHFYSPFMEWIALGGWFLLRKNSEVA
jgi:hypothetical protein